MQTAQQTTVEIISRLRVIQDLCAEIAARLEDEGVAQTIPRNFEYDGRRTALLEIAEEISKTMLLLEAATTSDQIDETIQALFDHIEQRKTQNEEAQAQNVEYKHNFRMSSLYFTPGGAIAGCDKALEWLRESLKSAGYPERLKAS
jgi:hypothetical protein